MKTRLILASSIAVAGCGQPPKQPPVTNRPPEWCACLDTTYGEMILTGADSGMLATYKGEDGKIYGTFPGVELDGEWVEPRSARECDSTRHGSPYWGRIHLEFDETRCSFEGRWGYCDDEPTRLWTGAPGKSCGD